MPEYLTTVLEIREAGIVLPSEGIHVMRVLGAAKEVLRPAPPPPKEATTPADQTTYEAYDTGTLTTSAEETDLEPGPARVPVLYVDNAGRPYLLRRR